MVLEMVQCYLKILLSQVLNGYGNTIKGYQIPTQLDSSIIVHGKSLFLLLGSMIQSDPMDTQHFLKADIMVLLASALQKQVLKNVFIPPMSSSLRLIN